MTRTQRITIQRLAVLVVAGCGMLAAGFGLTGAAHADLNDLQWSGPIHQPVYVPHVDTSVHHSH
jgi:hypothetical protein